MLSAHRVLVIKSFLANPGLSPQIGEDKFFSRQIDNEPEILPTKREVHPVARVPSRHRDSTRNQKNPHKFRQAPGVIFYRSQESILHRDKETICPDLKERIAYHPTMWHRRTMRVRKRFTGRSWTVETSGAPCIAILEAYNTTEARRLEEVLNHLCKEFMSYSYIGGIPHSKPSELRTHKTKDHDSPGESNGFTATKNIKDKTHTHKDHNKHL
jgi:hypothetical protein